MNALNRTNLRPFLIGFPVVFLIGCLGPTTVKETTIEDRTTLKITMTKEVAAVYVSTGVVLVPGPSRDLTKKIIEPETIKATGAGRNWKVDLGKLNLPEKLMSNSTGGEIRERVEVTIGWINKNDTRGKKNFSVLVWVEIINENGYSKRRLIETTISEN